jgi:hypothetical protein
MSTTAAGDDVRIVADQTVLELHRKLVTVFYVEER